MMLTPLKRKSVALVMLMSSGGIAFASCGGTEALVTSAAAKMAAALVAQIAAATTTLVTMDTLQSRLMVSSLRIATKQVQVSGDQFSNAIVEAEKSMANANRELADKELVNKVVVDFLSQGYDPCGQSAATKKLAVAENAVASAVPTRIKTEVEGAGGKYDDIARVLKERESQHQKLFCTQAEVDAGACASLGKVPGGDMNAGLLFSSDKSPDLVAAKNAVINNIVGLPDSPLSKNAVETPEGQAYLLEKKKKDAFLAFPAYSLKSIQSESELYKNELDSRVGQFFGTEKATEWAKAQASQAPRGVLVDLLKIQGLQLKIRERKLRQNLRIESNVAAMLELDNQMINGPLTDKSAQQIANAKAQSKVK